MNIVIVVVLSSEGVVYEDMTAVKHILHMHNTYYLFTHYSMRLI